MKMSENIIHKIRHYQNIPKNLLYLIKSPEMETVGTELYITILQVNTKIIKFFAD